MARVGITRIARELGVSVSTVHRALYNRGRISETTRQRVLETAQRLGYRPNLVARALRSQNTRTLGVIVTGISSSFYARMLEGIENAAREAGYSVLLANSRDDAHREREQIEVLIEKQAEALLVAPVDPRRNAEYYRELVAEGFRLVFLGRHVPGVPTLSVETDNVTGGYLVGQHLCALGRRNLAVLTTVPAKRHYSYVQERITGFQNALRERGKGEAPVLGEEIGEFPLALPEFAYSAVQDYLKRGGTLDALFAINDDLAFGVISALWDMGIRVPEQVAVVGFNDEWMSPYFRPALTTVRSAPQEMGKEAVRLVIESIERAEALAPRRILLEPALVIRQSCGARVNTNTDSRKEEDAP